MIFFRFIAGLCGAWLLMASAALSAQREIRISVQLPADSPLYQSVALFKSDVEKNTQDAIGIKIFPSGVLYKAERVRQAVASGEVEMGAVLLTEFVQPVPASDIFSLPFMFASDALLRGATAPDSPIRAPLEKAILEQTGSRVLWWSPSGATVILTKGAPVLTPDGIAGKKVRVSGSSLGEMVKLCGGTPVEAGGTEQYALYKGGGVDIGMSSVSIVGARKLWEVMDALTVTNHNQVEFLLVINEKVWQSLPPDQQQILISAARNTERIFRGKIEQMTQEGLAIARQQGMKVVEIGDAQIKEWKDCATPMLAGFLSRAGSLGRKMLDGYRKVLVESYRPTRR